MQVSHKRKKNWTRVRFGGKTQRGSKLDHMPSIIVRLHASNMIRCNTGLALARIQLHDKTVEEVVASLVMIFKSNFSFALACGVLIEAIFFPPLSHVLTWHLAFFRTRLGNSEGWCNSTSRRKLNLKTTSYVVAWLMVGKKKRGGRDYIVFLLALFCVDVVLASCRRRLGKLWSNVWCWRQEYD
jgi:hypothetical protein